MSNHHGGRKIKINFFSNEKGELVYEVREIAYPHSFRSKKVSGSGEWVLWEQKGFHRPAQAFQELFFALRDLKLIDNADAAIVASKYWARDLVISRDARLDPVKEETKVFVANQ